jgi:hypothetical protein
MAVDPRLDADVQSLLAQGGMTATYRARVSAGATFDPRASAAIAETFQSVTGLACSAPRALNRRLVEESGGRYTSQNWQLILRKADLDAVSVTPAEDDEVTVDGSTWRVAGIDLVYCGAAYRIVLRK